MFRYKLTAACLVFTTPLFSAMTSKGSGFILKITITGFLIVMVALTVVYLFVMLINAVLKMTFEYQHKREERRKLEKDIGESVEGKGSKIPDETATAIMMAVYLFRRQSLEEEKAKLTFERWAKPYSPWSSKIYGLRQPIVTIKRAGK